MNISLQKYNNEINIENNNDKYCLPSILFMELNKI